MLRSHMLTRTRTFALALLLLLTQQFGVLHSLSHVRLLPASVAVAVAGAATASNSTAAKTATEASHAASTELPADGLCQVCLLLVALGAAALPALLQWLAERQRSLNPNRTALPAWRARPGAPYLARAPPRGPALT